MGSISGQMINAAFDEGIACIEGRKSEAEVAIFLAEEFEFNKNSAKIHVLVLKSLLQGVEFKRTLSELGFRIFFDRIESDLGLSAFTNAVRGVQLHENCYGGKYKPRKWMRKLIVELNAKVATSPTFDDHLFAQVEESLAMSQGKRSERLAKAQKNPQKIATTVFVFVRNPDVVAEALIRADGSCEHCRTKAPFLRKSNGRPYLEVHHRIPLAEGGLDTVENAVALCPNCHREAHHGTNWEKFRK